MVCWWICSNWFYENIYWLIPLLFTIILTFINLIFNIIQTKNNAKQQRVATCINLMQKRMDIYYSFKSILESIINEKELVKSLFFNFERCYNEIPFLFGAEVNAIANSINELIANIKQNTQYVSDNLGGITIINSGINEEVKREACDELNKLSNAMKLYMDFSAIKLD